MQAAVRSTTGGVDGGSAGSHGSSVRVNDSCGGLVDGGSAGSDGWSVGVNDSRGIP